MSGDWREQMVARVGQGLLKFDAPLRQATTLRVGGNADCLAQPQSEAELEGLVRAVAELGLPLHVLGKGSNVLVPDGGLRGVALHLGKGFQGVARVGNMVTAGAGGANGALVEKCRRWGLGGLEFLIAVPGSVGGAIAMNAGAHDGETAGRLRAVRFLEIGAGIKTQPAAQFSFAYRRSPLRADLGKIVLAGEFLLTPAPPAEIAQQVAQFQAYRRDTQPRDFPNCGSVFKNPPGDHAARLIEAAGLKGHRLGGAQVSEKHANFIVNRGGATAADVLRLVDFIQQKVYSLTGVTLEMELQVL